MLLAVTCSCIAAALYFKQENAIVRSLAQNPESKCAGKVYSGAWFDVLAPEGFEAFESLPSATSDGYDSVWFKHPQLDLQLYIYSPQWGGKPSDIVDDHNILSMRESTEISNAQSITHRSMNYKDRQSGVFYSKESLESTSHLTTGYQTKKIPISDELFEIYHCFKTSVQQYTD